MSDLTFTLRPIGVVQTPYQDIQNMPIQPKGAAGARGKLVVHPEYMEGLVDLDGFSHIYLIYLFHQVREMQLTVTPFLDKASHGVFATRAPKRPNPIGLSVVRLIKMTDNVLELENVDMLDGTPILDIKPYVPAFDEQEDVRVGWLEKNGDKVRTKRSDKRFG